jgi:hypothetical protein
MIGDGQGGWLATVYAALYLEKINTLAGAPIEFHAGEPVVTMSAASVMRRAPRPWVKKLYAHRSSTSSRFWNPIK